MKIFDAVNDTIVPVKKDMALLLLILNILLPGIGTIVNSMMGSGITFGVIIGLMQAGICFFYFWFSLMFLVGWLWSVIWGCLIMKKAGGGTVPVGGGHGVNVY